MARNMNESDLRENSGTSYCNLDNFSGTDIFGNDLDKRAVVEPYYSEIVESIEKLEKDLVLLSQSALVYLQCCTEHGEAWNMMRVLGNLLDEHKLQMKIIDCSYKTFCYKN